MRSYVDERLEALRATCLGWDVRAVAKHPARGYWRCARPKGHAVATINADSPEALIAEIREQQAAS